MSISIDLNTIYVAWRAHMLEHSVAKHFGMISDETIAEFPYANVQMIGNSTASTDFENNEGTWNLSFQTDCYIDNNNPSELTQMDMACRDFFMSLGFRKTGDSMLIKTGKVTRVTSRFNMPNYNGRFLREL